MFQDMSRLLLAHFILVAILLQIQCSYGYDDDATTHSVSSRFVHSSSSSSRSNASMMLFFHVEDLRVGNKIPFFFRRSDRAPNFISREKANSLPPLSLEKLPEICRFFSLPPKSAAAEAMRQTLVICETPPVQGGTKLCATSKESMYDFVRGAFAEIGGGGDFKPLWTTHLTTPLPPGRGGEEARNYKILSFKEYRVPKAVGCHRMFYPYAVYLCHHFEGRAKVSMTQLESDGGDRVEALVFCHMETSTWGADHVAFQVLGTKPGVPVCHIFPEYDLAFIPRVSTLSLFRSRYLSFLAT